MGDAIGLSPMLEGLFGEPACRLTQVLVSILIPAFLYFEKLTGPLSLMCVDSILFSAIAAFSEVNGYLFTYS